MNTHAATTENDRMVAGKLWIGRSLIQERLKLPGAWLSPDQIETMLALRLNRANRAWEAYWRGVEKEAA